MKQTLLVLAGICLLCFQAYALDEKEQPPVVAPAKTVSEKESSLAAIELANLFFDPDEINDEEIDEWIWLF
ncbi:MAG: hypothetical protein JWM04_1544 [Verrucomicrobiales bacterium]|jgi:hypothetical protein|nr:hypothetical protein [Verrucomicrobiales bacterium]